MTAPPNGDGGDDLWKQVKTEARPLVKGKRRLRKAAPGNAPFPPRKAPACKALPRPASPAPKTPPGSAPGSAPPAPGLDRRTAERLKRGQLALEARLDLHGLTQEAAHRALNAFLRRAADEGKRTVLVITGKGEAKAGGGVLRTNLPRWLATPPLSRRVLSVVPAKARDGGLGAFYVRLRKERAPR